MLRVAVLSLLLVPFTAKAQAASYCSGGVVADRFDTNVIPGPPARATYFVVLRNTNSRARRVEFTVTASLIGRPTGMRITLNPGPAVTLRLGYEVLVGSPARRGEALANVFRLSCV